MKKVIFLGSKPIGYKCLEFLLKNKTNFDIEILAVFSNDNTRFGADFSVKKLALDNEIPFYEDASSLLEFEQVDLLVSVQYHQILKKEHIAKGILAVNLHMAPLPE